VSLPGFSPSPLALALAAYPRDRRSARGMIRGLYLERARRWLLERDAEDSGTLTGWLRGWLAPLFTSTKGSV
jgi:hypothetical protein